VQYDDKVVAEVLKKHFPDYRRVLNELQRYSVSGTIDAGIVFRKIYDTLLDDVKYPAALIVLLADYQYKSAFATNQEINLVACLVEIMAGVEWK